MSNNFILTLTGPDRIGIVEQVTRLVFERGGNVEASRMARLGGEFAVLMLVSMPAAQVAGLDGALGALAGEGYKISTTAAERPRAEVPPGWTRYTIEVQGADHEGIIHEVAHYLSARGINIESVDSETTAAPVSGSPLFAMTAEVLVPPGLPEPHWDAGLEALGTRMNLEIKVSPSRDR
jgi:glycine cleavage system transcriptional repressor